MFGKNKEQSEKQESQPEAAGLPSSQDLIVHNMPTPAKLSGSFFDSIAGSDGSFGLNKEAAKESNFKAVGLLIIAGGVIFIGILVYLSYHYIISPTAGKNLAATVAPTTLEMVKTDTADLTPAPETATVTPATVVTPIPSEIATSSDVNSLLDQTAIASSSTPIPLLDSDSDGLFDDEEILLGTSATFSDSDGDGYSDLTEINKGYNPAGAGKLSDNAYLSEYNNPIFSYSIFYPRDWVAQSLTGNATVIFTAPDNSLIQISAQENSDRAGILGWYESAFSDVSATYDQLLSSASWDGVIGTDNLNFYLTDLNHKNIYVISYISAVADRLAYPNIFKLMINSLVIK